MVASDFEQAFEKVGKLVLRFKENEDQYLSANYQEAEVRKDFVDKFFTVLGWDVNHDVQTNPYAQEVKVERSGGYTQRRADYAFYLSPNFLDVRFYVEAKKPHGDIATPDNYFQATRYGYGSTNPVAVLTDFQQFHVLDCRYRPDIGTAIHRAIAKFHYSQYLDREEFAKIYWLFSREAVASGSIESFAKGLPKPRGKSIQRGLYPGADKPVDESLLEELDEYRKTLARTFKARNPQLDSETLTEITQRAIDRLVFLRFLEDKQIETTSIVDKFGSRGTPWEDFVAASRRLDAIYNGVVFKRHDILDSRSFRADEDAFVDICERLSHVNSAYNFDAIPIHILGSIYERFLSKVIVATDKRVRVEEKSEVRKAGGVYYTPEYIVRYIVENTVGKLIATKTPEQIADMRFVDIACGSGSFLLGVYDLLLQHHGNYYNANPSKIRKGDCIERDGRLYLSLQKKRELLLKNIYGVDIDSQAAEVCQLSLYLRLLKDETTASAHQYLLDFARVAQLKKLLPDLSKNIVCGNSVVGTEVFDGELFVDSQERKLNPMNLEDAFPEIVKRGGFDAVVGNPPYIPIESMSRVEREYFQSHYQELERKFDSSIVFILKGLSLLNQHGLLGYISSVTWQTGENYSKLREALFAKAGVKSLVNLPFDVFKDAYVDTGIYIVGREHVSSYSICRIPKKAKIESLDQISFTQVESALVEPPSYKVVLEPTAHRLLGRFRDAARFTTLGAVTKSTQGLAANRFRRTQQKPNDGWYPFADVAHAYRYRIQILETSAADMNEFTSLKQFYEAEPKILVRRVINRQDRLDAAYFDRQMVFKKDLNPFVLIDPLWHPFFLLATLNSRLFSYLYINTSTIATKDDFRQTTLAELRRLPLVRVNTLDAAEKSRHDQIVRLATRMQDAKSKSSNAQTDKDKTFYENSTLALDRQIDHLIYELYGVSEQEISAIETR
ncbi:MAG TPA: N-6 DNA methylase [Candidatus Acidoferrales bacterium]|nr:N-6 DNA methylase [Candidatus Acidoferrales bacterium]